MEKWEVEVVSVSNVEGFEESTLSFTSYNAQGSSYGDHFLSPKLNTVYKFTLPKDHSLLVHGIPYGTYTLKVKKGNGDWETESGEYNSLIQLIIH